MISLSLPNPRIISSLIPHRARDKRWQNFDLLPVTTLLLFFSTSVIAFSASELSTGFSIFPLLILLTSCITFTHTLLDLLLYCCGHLRPVYVLCMSVLMTIFWLVAVGLGAADIAAAAGGKRGCCGARLKNVDYRLRCVVPKARLAVEVAVLVLYVLCVVMAALAHERYVAFKRFELLEMCDIRARRSVRAEAVQLPPRAGVDDIVPDVPPRAANRMSLWGFEENEKAPVFEEARRVLSVRNV